MSEVFFYKTCDRCHNQSKYVSDTYYKQLDYGNLSICKYCKLIPDESLQAFVNSIYLRLCPICDRLVIHKNRTSFCGAVRLNKPCKSCTNRKTTQRKMAEKQKIWEPIIGRWGITPRLFEAIRKHWTTLTPEQQAAFMKKTEKQKRCYWSHLRRHNQAEGHRKCREIIAEKYSGENHWIKRPEVMAKIKKSCEKYRGDGHWFRRGKL